MDSAAVVSKLADLDPGFRQICETLFPGFNPAEVYDTVYKANGVVKPPMSPGKKAAVGTATAVGTVGALAVHPKVFDAAAMKLPRIGAVDRGIASALRVARVAKSEPSSADVHVPSPVWRNGRGHTKGRGRRKIETDVRSIRFQKIDKDKVTHNIGLGTTAIGAGISAVSLPKHLRHIPGALRNAKTGPSVAEGMKSSMRAVRQFSTKPVTQGSAEALKPMGTGAGHLLGRLPGAVKAGATVARENPRISAGLVVGAAALHTANLGGEAIATRLLHQSKPKQADMVKAWDQAQEMILHAHADGRIDKAEALALGAAVAADLGAVGKAGFGYETTSANIKLTPLKAPKVDPPQIKGRVLPTRQTARSVQIPKGKHKGKTAGRKAGGQLHTGGKEQTHASGKGATKSVHKTDAVTPEIDISGLISKVDEDRQQCFGWCSVVKVDGKDVIDKQNDLIEIEDIEKAAYDYVLGSRIGGDMHRRAVDGDVHKVADMIESFVMTPDKRAALQLPETVPLGWWIGMQVHDPDVWSDVKIGKRKGFSIHGKGHREEVLIDD
jgi:hypothetical protein